MRIFHTSDPSTADAPSPERSASTDICESDTRSAWEVRLPTHSRHIPSFFLFLPLSPSFLPFLPRPVLRERVGVRVQAIDAKSRSMPIAQNPHVHPLPEYREREPEEVTGALDGARDGAL